MARDPGDVDNPNDEDDSNVGSRVEVDGVMAKIIDVEDDSGNKDDNDVV